MVSHLPRTANQNPVDRLPYIDDTAGYIFVIRSTAKIEINI